MKVNNIKYEFQDIEVSSQSVLNDDDVMIYGWCIEVRCIKHYIPSWKAHYKNKLYKTELLALDAITQMIKSTEEEYRVIPLYTISNKFNRNIKINQIIK